MQSVPTVVPDSKVREALAKCLELGREAVISTGNIEYLQVALTPIRSYYEEVLKPAANEGRFDYAKLEAYRKAIERLDTLVARVKERSQ